MGHVQYITAQYNLPNKQPNPVNGSLTLKRGSILFVHILQILQYSKTDKHIHNNYNFINM